MATVLISPAIMVAVKKVILIPVTIYLIQPDVASAIASGTPTSSPPKQNRQTRFQ